MPFTGARPERGVGGAPESGVSYAPLGCRAPGANGVEPRDGHLWRECCVYVLVIGALVLMNAFVRLHPDAPTAPGELRDAAGFLFPHLTPRLNASAPARGNENAMYVEGREDIHSFGFDLGGSTCACALQWDARQYWQRVFYGTKYVVFHCTTVFFGVLCLQRPQWVVLWKVLNEVLEEIGMPIVGKFAWTVSVFNLESRYDTLVNDLLLAVVPFGALGLHVVTVLKLADPIRHPAEVDKAYLAELASVFLQYNMFLQANQSHIWLGGVEARLGGFACNAGRGASCLLQIALVWLLVGMRRLSRGDARAVSVFVGVLWAPFVVHRVGSYDEQVIAILSFALTGMCVCCYQWLAGTHPRLLVGALPCYAVALALWWDFEAILAPPSERFYYHAQWCGLSEGAGSWFSCAAPRE